jgi:hypothetical protein
MDWITIAFIAAYGIACGLSAFDPTTGLLFLGAISLIPMLYLSHLERPS